MEILKGEEVKLSEKGFTWQGDLLWYDGPILSHFKNEKNEDFLMLWKDHDNTYNRWLLYKTPLDSLTAFFNNELSDVELILKNPDRFVYFVDIDSKWVRVIKVQVEDIPEIYLPEPTAYFGNDGFDEYAFQLKNKLLSLNKSHTPPYKVEKQSPSFVNEPGAIYKKQKKSNK